MSENRYTIEFDWFWICVVVALLAFFYFNHQDTAEKEQTKRIIITQCADVAQPDICIATMMDKLKEK